MLGLGACAVEPGAKPSAGACQPSPTYFAANVWLPYIDANQCATGPCHAQASGHGYLRYVPPGSPPSPGDAFSAWPTAWQLNYWASIQLVRCDQPDASRLLTVPEGKADPHPPGISVQDPGFANQLFIDWLASP